MLRLKRLLPPGRIAAIAISAAGVAAFFFAALPLPFLLGPLFACLIAALAGARMADMGVLGTAMRTILGVAVGASITPDLLQRMPGMASSVALGVLMTVCIVAIGYPFFRRVCGFDHPTAFYSAVPGGLQDMLVFGEEAGGDVRAMSLIHATRVLVIVSLAPFLMVHFWGVSLDQPPGAPAAEIPMGEIAAMILCGLAGWKVAARVGLFGASILGPLFATAALSLSGVITHRPPAEMVIAAQFFIGLTVGVKYAGVTWRELRVDVASGLGYCVVIGLIALGFAEIAIQAGLANPIEALLAFAPGGQAEMAILAIIVGADVAFVVTHHIVRILFVILLAPVFGPLLDRHLKR